MRLIFNGLVKNIEFFILDVGSVVFWVFILNMVGRYVGGIVISVLRGFLMIIILWFFVKFVWSIKC